MIGTNNTSIFASAFALSILLFSPIALAQVNFIELYVNPNAGKTTDEYRFTVSWDINVIRSETTNFNIKLQYKDSSQLTESAWKDYTGAIQWDGPVYTGSDKKMKRDFRLIPSKISEIANLPSGFAGSYSFRIIDNSFPADKYPSDIRTSTSTRIKFNNNCNRGTNFARAELIQGDGYTKTGSLSATVDVEQGNQAGLRTFLYDVYVQNLDSGCGTFSDFQFDVFETTPKDKGDERRKSYSWKIASVKRPDGSVTQNPDTKTFKLRAGDAPTVFRLEVTAGREIEPGKQASSTITISVINVDSLEEISTGKNIYTAKVDEIGTITANTVRRCEQKKPKIKIDPVSRSGYRGDILSYLVSIYNENTGNCAPEDFYITKVGVLKLDQKLGDSHELSTVIPDTNVNKWKITQRVMKDGVVKDYTFNSGSGSFKYAGGGESGDNYASFTPRDTVRFSLGSSDDFEGGKCKACVKTIILKIESYSLDTSYGQRSIVVCVNKDNVCNSFTYNLIEIGQTKPPDTGASVVVDSALNDPKPPAIKTVTGGSGSVGGGGGQVVSGTPVVTGPKIDPKFKSDCRACTKQSRKGLFIDESGSWSCLEGVAYGTTVFDANNNRYVPDGKGTIYKGNWIYVPTELSKIIIRDDGIRRSSYSCEKPPAGVGISSGSSMPTSPGVSASACSAAKSCDTCTPSIAASCGWSISQGRCLDGTRFTSNDGSSRGSDWVWYSRKSRKPDQSSELACDEISGIPATSKSSGSEAECNKYDLCSYCTPDSTKSCGWSKTAGKCKHGTVAGSDDAEATVSKGNWVWYTTKSSRGSNPGLSCEEI